MAFNTQPLQIRGIVGATFGQRNAVIDLSLTDARNDAAADLACVEISIGDPGVAFL